MTECVHARTRLTAGCARAGALGRVALVRRHLLFRSQLYRSVIFTFKSFVTSVSAWPHGLPCASQALSWLRRSAFPMKQADARSWQAPGAIIETLGPPGRTQPVRSRSKCFRDT